MDMGRTIHGGGGCIDTNVFIEPANDIDVIDLDNSPMELNNNSEFYSKFESDFRQRMGDLSAENRLDMQINGKRIGFASLFIFRLSVTLFKWRNFMLAIDHDISDFNVCV